MGDAMQHRHAVVTGGGSGIGLAIAQALHKAGCQVTILGRSREKLDKALETLPNAQGFTCDVTDEIAVNAVFSKLQNIAILVNNAGAVETQPFQKTDDAHWRRTLDVNLMGTVNCTRACLDQLKQQSQGRIINIASTAALKGYPYVSAYVAAKHAVLGFTRALALELANTDITVNALCPGYTDTEIVEHAISTISAKTGRSSDDARASLTKANPQGRLITSEEVANATIWLISDGARSITGQAIAIAGGEVM